MDRISRAAVVVVAMTLLAVGCGGDDDSEATDATSTPPATAASTTITPATTASPASESAATLPPPSGPGDLEAWCVGWIDGGVIDLPTVEEEMSAMEANAVEMNRVVPEEVREAWVAYTGGPSVPEDKFREAYRVIDRFFIDNCDMISVGTPITAAP